VVLLRNGYSVKIQVMKTRFAKFLAIMLVITLAFGQGLPVMAMPAMSADQMSMDMAGMDMSASTTDQASKDCCGHSDKDKGMKGMTCDACCTAATQTALLPFQSYAPVQYAVAYSYEMTDTTAVSKILPPEPPPPKA
jgi:hypothetical protein